MARFPSILITASSLLILAYGRGEEVKPKSTRSIQGDREVCAGIAADRYTKNTSFSALMTDNGKLYFRSCFASAMKNILHDTTKPFVLFVSGRGQYPSKEIKNRILQKMELQYDIKAAMFIWPSWCGYRCFPDKNAYQASNDLLLLLVAVAAAKRTDSCKHRIYTLLSHSMGSLVLEGVHKTTMKQRIPKNLFDNIIIDSAAS